MARRVSSVDRDKIYEDVGVIASSNDKAHFIENFMKAYNYSNASITKMQKGLEKSNNGCYIQKGDFHFQEVPHGMSVGNAFLKAQDKCSAKERFVIATDFQRFMARDNNTKFSIDIPFKELAEQYEFFLPLCGIEKQGPITENVADVKAARKMAELFDEIKKDNLDDPKWNLTDRSLTDEEKKKIERNYALFFTRLLFCLFADDTNIFADNQFQDAIEMHTDEDGKNLSSWLGGLFKVLDLPMDKRACISPSYVKFPYVNGGLFRDEISVPRFNYQSRKKLIESGNSDWSQINPDIFGSMFQGVISPEQRSELGQHYTSVSNIMKVIKPLFLDDLHEELNAIKGNDKKLDAFRLKLSRIKIFDPACGSGNFLIIAYKELCRLEMEALDSYIIRPLPLLSIKLKNFYGIEIDEFPCEVARLSLWLAQHQINMECYAKYGNANSTLPLTPTGNIVCGNACRLDWEKVCPCGEDDIVYICGNPPFAGHRTKTDEQRKELKDLFSSKVEGTTDFDYVACWYLKASQYIRKHNYSFSFVSTNSISQGKVVESLWSALLGDDLEIAFAYTSFKWSNNAKNQAGVTVVIIGVRPSSNKPKYIYEENSRKTVLTINGYLKDNNNPSVKPCSKVPFGLPKACYGPMALDGGNLILSTEEKDNLIKEYPNAIKFIRPFIGAKEFIRSEIRWCLWIDDEDLQEALRIPEISLRIDKTREKRMSQPDTIKLAQRPWQMREHPDISGTSIIIPTVSSETREYIPIGFLHQNTVIAAPNFALYDAPLWLFSILTSKMHMAWMRTVGGKLKTDYRYSNTLCYNTFPFPTLTDAQKSQLEATATNILMARENHYDMTLAQQYDPDNMPEDLRQAHNANDLLVDSLYRTGGFANDEERLAELFKRYKKLVEEAK